jgi:anhydro-N-acetylmuramic acid kinase
MPSNASMIVAGVMSGTSADGIDVALLRIAAKTASRPGKAASFPRLTLLAHRSYPFPRALRTAILAAMAGQSNSPNTTTGGHIGRAEI